MEFMRIGAQTESRVDKAAFVQQGRSKMTKQVLGPCQMYDISNISGNY